MDEWLDLSNNIASLGMWARLAIVFGIILVALLVNYVFIHWIMPAIKRFTRRTKAEWDDIMLSPKLVKAFGNILPPIILLITLPIVFEGEFKTLLVRCLCAYIIAVVVRFLCVLVSAVFNLFVRQDQSRIRMKGITQTLQIIFIILGVIFVISTLIDKSPVILITGLGAMATVMMLIFQDSIKGLVAGIQLSANDMLNPGDWISMPKCGADGEVIDVSLHTVKVRNWDKTIITIPPYMLVNESFQNWRGMQESGGRRIFRSVNIDMQTIRFCTQEELHDYRAQGILPPEYVLQCPTEREEEKLPQHMTNLQVFRNYLLRYLQQHPDINHGSLIVMVRELQPSAEGIPLQIYCFSDTTTWVSYENIQSQLIEFLIASLPKFGLAVYQRSSDNEGFRS